MRLVRVLASGQCSWESKSVLEKYALKYFNMPDTLDSLISLQGPMALSYPTQKASSTGNLDWVSPHILKIENTICFKTLILKGKAASSLLRVFWDNLIALRGSVEERIKSRFGFIFSFSMVSHILYLFKQTTKEKIAKNCRKNCRKTTTLFWRGTLVHVIFTKICINWIVWNMRKQKIWKTIKKIFSKLTLHVNGMSRFWAQN